MAQASTRAAVAIAAMGIAAIAGCSSTPQATSGAAATSTTTTSPVTVASPTTGPTTTGAATGPTTGPTTPPSPPHSRPAAVPTLGRLAGDFAHGQGFGQVKPTEIFNGGDPTGLVTHVTWSSWGAAQAQATGTSEYIGPNQSVASGRPATATVVAFDLGHCGGKLMYQAVEWYFPQHGQSFNPHHYENICTGSYVPSQ